ncbi:DNA-3-methyladenine glycosylase 2 family protein [Cellulomonas rhizosphaerae]|uniref:DNA-3-methyladenine glycosylase II n=1 Tax=Cellulomonas rhizosphaerae TaxID=2293719 RepID=A0A413RQN5_9CELL|nr:DNA-3-methyladenine glycosylase 2 family protein [Cellulomonas rhizosphaerae]
MSGQTRAVDVPLDPGPLLGSLRAHAVPGVEEVDVDAGTVRRAVRLADGPTVVEARLAADRVEIRVIEGSASDDELAALATRWFGLADDVAAVGRHFADDPVLAPLVAARPRLRILGHPDGFEAAVQTVLGQQVSLAAARTFTGRFAAAFGMPGPGGFTVFPTPSAVVGRDADEVQAAVRVTGARARTLVALARACADGLDLAPGIDLADVRARLLALPGIGPWTVEYLALRVLGDRDAFPAGDLVLRRALDVPDTRAVDEAGRPWAPLRAFAAQHLWTVTAYPA